MSSMDKFKDDYPEVFEKFLEMNRALAKIQRALMKERARHTREPVRDTDDDGEPGLFLELD